MAKNEEFVDDYIFVAENDYTVYKYFANLNKQNTASEIAQLLEFDFDEAVSTMVENANLTEFMKVFLMEYLTGKGLDTWTAIGNEIKSRWSE